MPPTTAGEGRNWGDIPVVVSSPTTVRITYNLSVARNVRIPANVAWSLQNNGANVLEWDIAPTATAPTTYRDRLLGLTTHATEMSDNRGYYLHIAAATAGDTITVRIYDTAIGVRG